MGFPLYGGAVIDIYMLKQITMTRSTYGLGFSLLSLFAGVPSPAIAATIHRCGVRQTLLIGSGLTLFGSLWMAWFASEPWHYLAGFGILIGTGIGFATVVPLATATTRWFVRYRGRAMAIALTASGFAGLEAAPLMNKFLFIPGVSWRFGWLVIAGIFLASAAIAFCTVEERPEDLVQNVDGELPSVGMIASGDATSLVSTYAWMPSDAFHTVSFWMILVGSVACQYPFFFFSARWILHLRGLGISPANSALPMDLFTMGSIPKGIIGGWLMDKLPARFAFMIELCCYIAGSLVTLRITSGSLATAFTAAILFSAGFRWSFVCLTTITGHFYGPAAYPKLSGILPMFSSLVFSRASLVGGKLFDIYKSYRPAFELNILICLIGIVVLAFARVPQQPE